MSTPSHRAVLACLLRRTAGEYIRSMTSESARERAELTREIEQLLVNLPGSAQAPDPHAKQRTSHVRETPRAKVRT
jgi:hypothetical protein